MTSKHQAVAAICAGLLFAACGGSTANTDDGGTDAATEGGAEGGPVIDAGPPGSPITGLTQGKWTWVDIAGAKCRDGTPTGIGVDLGADTTKVMIFLEGGGACFNATTCGTNPSHFDSVTFGAQFVIGESTAGIFSRTDSQNSVKDWTMVYVPYCTGDVHAGSATDAQVPGFPGKQQFVGYMNMDLDLARIVATFPNASQVLLTGQSAGGFGAALNYVHVARAFGSNVHVDLVDDSGPLLANPYMAPCLEQSLVQLFGLSSTILNDCGSDCTDPSNDMIAYWKHLPKTYPDRRFGFVDSAADSVISSFFGFGANNCTSFVSIPPATYEAGLLDMRTQVASDPNIGSFLFPGGAHTSIVSAYTTRSAMGGDGGTVLLEQWVNALLAGSVTNVGP
jgi:hypothetical protein